MTERTDIPRAGLTAETLRDILRRNMPDLPTFTTLRAIYHVVDEEWYDTEAWNEPPNMPDGNMIVIANTDRDDMNARLLEAGFVPKIGRLEDGEAWIEGWEWP